MTPTLRSTISLLLLLAASSAFGAAAPVIESFTVTPAVPVPGQNVTLNITARDPDCTAPPCTTGCGTSIRSDLLFWSDDTGRTTGAFTGSTAAPATGSPWSASVTWIAPSTAGTYTVRANVADNGGMLCGGRQTKVATLQINVSSSRPPKIESCTVSPSTLPAGGTATITAAASDPLGRPLTYSFAADAGSIAQSSGSANTATWTAPKIAGNIALRCTAIAEGVPATLQTMANVEIGAFVRTLAVPNLRATRTTALPDGRIAAVDGTNGVLTLVSTSGSSDWVVRGLETPVAVTSSGDELYVLERGAARVSVWTRNGGRLRELPLALVMPNQLAAGPGTGELSIADSAASRIVIVSARDGAVLRTIGEGMLNVPAGLATSGGRVAVADAAAARVLIFSGDGYLQATLGDSTSLVRPQGLAWDAANQRVIVADSYSGELTLIGEENAVHGTLAGFGTAEGKLVNPIDVTLLAGGMLAVTTAAGDLPLYRLSATLAPLAPPTAVLAADRPADDGGAIAVTWTPSPDDARVTAYRVERAPQAEEMFTIVETLERASSNYVDTSVAGATCYRYRIVATDGAVDAASDATPCISAKNDLAPPAPATLVASADSPTSAAIEWGAVVVPDLAGYSLELTAPGLPAIRRDLATTAVAFAELTPGTTYDVTVRAVDTAGNASTPATAQLETYPDDPPAAPASVAVIDAKSGGAIDVSWTAPVSIVPIARYRVTALPSVDGWPVRTIDTSSTTASITGLVNQLGYRVSVTSIAPWNRESEPSAASDVTPTAPLRALPLVEATDEVMDAAGVSLQFVADAEKRELRLQYLASATTLQAFIDGAPVGAPLPDTAGAWTEASLPIDKQVLKEQPAHVLELRSSAFPLADARAAVRQVDFVPLAPKAAAVDSYNTVVDIVWKRDEVRHDLGVALSRDGVDVTCSTPASARCRDTFLPNGRQSVWTVRIVSPAGWMSEPAKATGQAKWTQGPPLVTDLVVAPRDGGFELTWTPLSSSPAKDSPPVAVKSYRIYAAGTLLGEVSAPPAFVRDVDPRAVVVRAVDAEGRESQ